MRNPLIDRVPVSDDKSIKVSGISIKPEINPADDGLLTWEVPVAPKSKSRVLLSYTVQYPTEIAEIRKSSLPASRSY